MTGRILGCAALLATAALALCAALAPGVLLVVVPVLVPMPLRLDFGVTPLARPFLILVSLVVPAVACWGLRRGAAGDGFRLALFVLAMIGVFLAQSVTAFFLTWEAMALSSAFLVGTHHERRDVRRALFSYLIVSQFGALCILAALVLLGVHAGSFRFADIALAAPAVPGALRSAIVGLALAGFGSKAGLVPLHFWLPLAHPVAPANASALLSGVMLNVAVYGLLLTGFVLAAPVPEAWDVAILAIGLLTAFTGALYAAVDTDLKRLLAYSSIENIGIITATLGLALLAAAAGAHAVATLAVIALLFHVLSHGTFKSLLFLGAGTVAETAHTTDLEHLGGLGRVLPFSAPFVLAGCCAAAALPPLTGFASEWLVFASFIRMLAVAPPLMQVAIALAIATLAIAGGLAALAFAKLFGVAFLGDARTAHAPAPERPDAAVLALALLTVVCFAFGLAPALVMEALRGVAESLVGQAGVLGLPAPPVVPAVVPLAFAALAFVLARRRGIRRVPTWTCGSPVTPRSQYTATAFSKPIRRIFGFVLFPDRHKVSDLGTSRWFPTRIRYEVTTRYVVDELARNLAALIQRLARRARIVQGGRLRVYLVYAVAAVLVIFVVAR